MDSYQEMQLMIYKRMESEGDYESLLKELLAVLHGDGGHHVQKVGVAMAVIQAMENHVSQR